MAAPNLPSSVCYFPFTPYAYQYADLDAQIAAQIKPEPASLILIASGLLGVWGWSKSEKLVALQVSNADKFLAEQHSSAHCPETGFEDMWRSFLEQDFGGTVPSPEISHSAIEEGLAR